MGDIDNTNDGSSFGGWEGYVNSQLQDNAPTRQEYFSTGDEPAETPSAFQQIVGGGIDIANNFLQKNIKAPVEKGLEGTWFEVEKGTSGGGEGTGKPARASFHNFKKDPICVENCIVQCPFGITFCKIQATPKPRTANVEGFGFASPMLTVYDHLAFTNVFPYNLFTVCQNPFNPYVIWATALATAAKGGVFTFTPWLCVGSIPLFSYVHPFWTPSQVNLKTNGMFALTQKAKISCWWPAELTIVHPGQGLDASWGKAMIMGPGGLAGIQNLVNMAGAVFSVAGGFVKATGAANVLDKAASICDLLDGSINLMSGDIIGALFSGVSGTLGLGGDNFAINRGIKKIADLTSDLLNRRVMRNLEIADVRRSARALGDDLPPGTRQQFNDALDRAENASTRYPQHNPDGTPVTPNTPHGDTISVNSTHPHGGDAPDASSHSGGGTGSHNGSSSSNNDNWKAKYRSEDEVPTVQKRKEAREAYREYIDTEEGKKWKAARDKLKQNPPVSQAEKNHLKDLETNKINAERNLTDHPAPSDVEMNNKKATSNASKENLKNYPEPTAEELRGLKAKEKAMKDAQAKIDNNRVTHEEREHLEELEKKAHDSLQRFSDDISIANNEADMRAWKEFKAEEARIAEKDRLFREGQQEIGPATSAYNSEKTRIDAKQTAHNKAANQAKQDEDAYLLEKQQYEQKLDEHNRAKAEAEEANKAYNKEKQRQDTKEQKHREAQEEVDRVKPENEDFMILGEEQHNQSGVIENIGSKISGPGKSGIKDGINDWANEVAPSEEDEKQDPKKIDTSWVGYDFSLDYDT